MLVAAEPDDRVGQRACGCSGWPGARSTRPTAAVHAREWAELATTITDLVQATRPERGRDWAEAQGALLLAIADGLATAVAVEPERMPGARAIELAESALQQLLDP